MKKLVLLLFVLVSSLSFSQDSTFWKFAGNFEAGEQGSLKHDWGSENVTYLGTVEWKSPSGKILEIKIITSYRKITQANGFNDKSILALVKTNNTLIKTFDMVKRQNLPLEIRDNELVFKPDATEIISAMPGKFTVRFCVEGMTCFDAIELEQ